MYPTLLTHKQDSWGKAHAQSSPYAPIAALRDLTVEQLPLLLKEERQIEFCEAIKSILPLLSPLFVSNYSHESLNLIAMDMAFLYQAACHKGWMIPSAFTALFEDLCQHLKRLPILLYEDCVFTNPLTHDPRLFSLGDVGKSEWHFLNIHKNIEEKLANIIKYIEDILWAWNHLDRGQINRQLKQLTEKVTQSNQELGAIGKLLNNLRKMPPEHFAKFRTYYSSLPNTSYFGPSGRFSAKFYMVRILIDGSDISKILPDFFVELTQNSEYFPQRDRRKLFEIIRVALNQDSTYESREYFHNLNQILKISNPSLQLLQSEIDNLGKTLDKLLGIHFGLVHRYVVNLDKAL